MSAISQTRFRIYGIGKKQSAPRSVYNSTYPEPHPDLIEDLHTISRYIQSRMSVLEANYRVVTSILRNHFIVAFALWGFHLKSTSPLTKCATLIYAKRSRIAEEHHHNILLFHIGASRAGSPRPGSPGISRSGAPAQSRIAPTPPKPLCIFSWRFQRSLPVALPVCLQCTDCEELSAYGMQSIRTGIDSARYQEYPICVRRRHRILIPDAYCDRSPSRLLDSFPPSGPIPDDRRPRWSSPLFYLATYRSETIHHQLQTRRVFA